MKGLLRWLLAPVWPYNADGTRTDPGTDRVERYEQCPSGWAGVWVQEKTHVALAEAERKISQ